MPIKVVSLFSGGGGLDLGFLNAGYQIIWAIDNDKNAVDTYRENIGNHIIHADINTIDSSQIPKCDLVIGGPPCQSFSLAGNRHTEDKRGKLVWKYIEIINTIKPQAFLFENVTGLTSAKDKNGEYILPQLKKAFEDIGYSITEKILNAVDYGVPQKRRRLIIVGLLGKNCFEFPNPTHSDNNPSLPNYVTVEDALSDLPPATQNEMETVTYLHSAKNPYQKLLRGDCVYTNDHTLPQMSELDKYIVSHVPPGGNYRDIPSDVNSERIKRLQREGGHTTCYGRMVRNKPAYTINTYFNRPNVGCNIHYAEDRLITVREALRLQSFPDSYKIISSSKQGRNLIVGNAVPPLLGNVLGKQLLKYINPREKED